jgi:serine phosphatase RsbU (regulator of sigma subunit)
MELNSPVEELFARLNRSLHRVLDDRTFICFTLGELDLHTHALRLANSGCPYPYYFNATSVEVKEVQIDTYPLGCAPTALTPCKIFSWDRATGSSCALTA